jgi:hypothetical protein
MQKLTAEDRAWVEPALTKLPDTMFTGFMKLTERAR